VTDSRRVLARERLSVTVVGALAPPLARKVERLVKDFR